MSRTSSKKGRGLLVDEGKDAVVHLVLALYRPSEALFHRVECPQVGIVALRGDDSIGTEQRSQTIGQFVGTAHMSAQHRDDVQAHAIDAYHSGVGMLVVHVGRYGSYTDAHCSDEDEGIIITPMSTYVSALNDFSLGFFLNQSGGLLTCL